MKYKIKKITDKIYLTLFDEKDRYDLCMFFLRYSEFYESPNPKFRNHAFMIVDFMDWYSKNKRPFFPYFSYPGDWGGFNLPSYVIDKVHQLGIPDFNKYDKEMKKLHDDLKKRAKGDYYLIGAFGGEGSDTTIAHEAAHGLYSTVPEYKKSMDVLVKSLPKVKKVKINSWLKSIGYTKEVYIDETQAYLSTGFDYSEFGCRRLAKPFIKVFQEYAKNISALKDWEPDVR